MAERNRNLNIGARNPYALAELVQGKKIDWMKKSSDRKVMILENTFGMPVERLFNPDPRFKSPVYCDCIGEVLPDVPLFGTTELANSCADPDAPYGDYIKAPGMEGVDPAQSAVMKNCSLIAGMASCAWTRKGPWFQNVTTNQAVQNSYSLQFYDSNKTIPVVSCSSYLSQAPLGTLIYARSTTVNECWPGIIEKGYYQAREWVISGKIPVMPDYQKFNSDDLNPTKDPATVLYQLLKVNANKKKSGDADYNTDSIFNNLVSIGTGALPNRKILYPAVAWTYANAPIVPQHTFSILGVTGTYSNGTWRTRYIVLRDPFTVTTDPPFPDVLTSGIWYNRIDFTKGDGIIALDANRFTSYFQGYAWAVC